MSKLGNFYNYVKQHPLECCIVGVGFAVGAVFALREVCKARKTVPADEGFLASPEPLTIVETKEQQQPVVASKDPEVPDTPPSPKSPKVKCLTKKEKKKEARRKHLEEKDKEILERRIQLCMSKLRMARQRLANPDEEYYPKEKKEPSKKQKKWAPIIAEAERRLEEEDREEERKRREKFGW